MVDREKVAFVREVPPPEHDVTEATNVFALSGDRNRLGMLPSLLEGGGVCECDLAAAAGMSESATSRAVRWLRTHRVVSASRRQGRLAYYRLGDTHVPMLLDPALTYAQHTTALHPDRHDVSTLVGVDV